MKGTFIFGLFAALMLSSLALLLSHVAFAAPIEAMPVGVTSNLPTAAFLLSILLRTGLFRRIQPNMRRLMQSLQPLYASNEAAPHGSNPFTRFALLAFLALSATAVSAQVTISLVGVTNGPNNMGATQSPDRFVVGAGPSRVTYRILNNTIAVIPIGTSLTMDLPVGGSYVAGSAIGMTDNGGTANVPAFTTASAIVVGGTLDISYLATFDCSVIPFINGGGQTFDVATLDGNLLTAPGTYNVVSAALSIIDVTNPAPTQSVGTSYLQTVTIRNGGINSIVPAPVTLDLGGATGTSISAPTIGTLSGNTLTFSAADITATSLFNDDGDNQWENGEDLVVTYTVTVNNCLNLTRNLTAYWGDGTSTCQTSAAFPTGVTISNLVPNVTVALSATTLTTCAIDVPRTFTLTVSNTGTGPANIVNIEMLNVFANSFTNGDPGIIDIASIVVNLPGGSTFTPGTANTTVVGTIAAVTLGGINNGCATGLPGHVRVNLPTGTLLPAGQSFTVTYSLRYCDNNGCSGGYRALGHAARVSFQDQCLGTVRTTPLSAGVGGLTAYIDGFSAEVPALVQNGQCLTVGMTTQVIIGSNVNSPNDQLDFSVALPSGFTYNPGSLVSPTGYTIAPGFPQEIAGRLVIRYINPPILIGGVNQGAVTVRFGVCVNQMPCVGGFVDLAPEVAYVIDPTCTTPVQFKRCLSSSVGVDCPCCPEGGLEVAGFNFRRTTLGVADNNQDGLADAGNPAPDPNLISLNRYRPGDELTAEANGIIRAGATYTNWNYVYADWTFTQGNWQPVGTATITITDVSTGTTHTATGVAITGTSPGKSFAVNWDAAVFSPALPAGFIYTPDDLVATRAVFRLTATTSIFNGVTTANVETGGVNPFSTTVGLLNQGFYATQVATPAPNAAALTLASCVEPTTTQGLNRYQCGAIRYSHYLRGFRNDIVFDGLTPFTTSCGARSMSFRSETGLSFNQFFPFEYRPINRTGTMILTLPPGAEYVAGAGNFVRLRRTVKEGFQELVPDVPVTPTVSGSVATGQILTYNIAALYVENGGTLVNSTEGHNLSVFVNLRPNCALDGTVQSSLRHQDGTFLTWASTATPNAINLFRADAGLLGYTSNTIKPEIVLSSAVPSVNIEAKKATWTLVMNNPTNNAASFSFIALANAGPFNNVMVMEGATTYTPNANGIIELGITNGAATRTFTLMADINDECGTGQLQLAYGWDCGGYPTDLALFPCEAPLTLSAMPLPAGLDITFDFLPNGAIGMTGIDLCEPVTVRADINSTLQGALETVQYKVLLPTGMTYVPNSVIYTFPIASGTPTASAYTPTLMGNMLIFEVPAIAPALANGLTGVTGTNRDVRIDFQLTTDCNFTSGTPLTAEVRGKLFCGNLVPLNNPLRKSSNLLNVNGLVLPYNSSVTTSVGSTLVGCTATATMAVEVILSGQTLAANEDKTVVRLPAGISYVSTTCTSPNAFNCPNAPTSAVDPGTGETVLTFTYPTGIPQMPGQAINFNIVIGTGFSTACGALAYEVSHQVLGNQLACSSAPGGFCPRSSAISSLAAGVIGVDKPQFTMSGFSATANVPSSGTINTYNTQILTITNTSTVANAPAGIVLEFYCNDGMGQPTGSPIGSVLLPAIAAGASTTNVAATFTGSCNLSNGLVALIQERTNAATPAPGAGNVDQCLCPDALPVAASMFDCFSIADATPVQNICAGTTPSSAFTFATQNTATNGISFVYFIGAAPANPYSGGTPLGNGTGNGTNVILAAASLPTAIGDYYIYALQAPIPSDPACRPAGLARLTINANPTASIITNNGPICSGSDAVFTVTGTNGATLTYNTGAANTTLALTGANQTITVSGATANTTLTLVSVSITTGGLTCTPLLTATSTVTVAANPTASIVMNNSPICSGSDAVFTVTGTNGATLTYNAGAANATLALTGINQTITVSGATANTTLTLVSVATSVPVCTTPLTATSTVTVASNPTASIITNNDPICSGSDAIFTVTGTNGATLTYNTGAANTTLALTGANQTITVSGATANTTLTLVSVATSVPVCTTPLTATSTVTVASNPTASIITNNGPICSGSDAVFTVTGTNGATLTYNTGAANTTLALTGVNQTITVTGATTNTTLTLVSVATSIPICTTPLTATSIVTVSQVPNLPSGPLSLTNICPITTVDLSTLNPTDANGTTGTLSYHNSLAGASEPNNNTTDVLASPTTATTPSIYYIRKTTSDGCFDYIAVDVIQTSCCAAPMLTVQSQNVCPGGIVQLESLVMANTPTGTLTFHISQADADAGINPLVNTTVLPLSSTIYYVRSTTGLGSCFSTAALVLTMANSPALVVINGQTCAGGSIDLATLVTATGGGTLSFYTTQANANAGTNALASSTVSPASATNYYVRSSTAAGCYGVREIIITITPVVCIQPTITGPN